MGNLSQNIFTYATSELSQDAFLCWLLSHAMKDEHDDPVLRKCAEKLLRETMPAIRNLPEIYVSKIERQPYHIDVLVTVNDVYCLIIEDKTYTQAHDQQLERYIEDVTNNRKIPKEQISKLYVQTGFVYCRDDVLHAGYEILDLPRMIGLFREFQPQIKSEIFQQFWQKWSETLKERETFEKKPIAEWSYDMVNAAMDKCRKSTLKVVEFSYVPNPSGGFIALTYDPDRKIQINETIFHPYLQMETYSEDSQGNKGCSKICLKLSIDKDGADLKDNASFGILRRQICNDAGGEYDQGLKDMQYGRPDRFGTGKTMTIGVYEQKADSFEELLDAWHAALENFDEVCGWIRSKVQYTAD